MKTLILAITILTSSYLIPSNAEAHGLRNESLRISQSRRLNNYYNNINSNFFFNRHNYNQFLLNKRARNIAKRNRLIKKIRRNRLENRRQNIRFY